MTAVAAPRKEKSGDNPQAERRKQVLAELTALQTTDTRTLRARWAALFDTDPPVARATLIQRLAYRIQELAFGGLSNATRERLLAIAKADDGKPGGTVEKPVVGTVYQREWHGELYVVEADNGGFVCRGEKYRSLSAVAKAITGQHWNGKLFFGVTTRKGGK